MKGKKIMKKMFLTLVAVMSMTMAFAEGENTVATNTVAAYDMKVNYSKLAEALGSSMDQLESVEDVHKTSALKWWMQLMLLRMIVRTWLTRLLKRTLKYMHYSEQQPVQQVSSVAQHHNEQSWTWLATAFKREKYDRAWMSGKTDVQLLFYDIS